MDVKLWLEEQAERYKKYKAEKARREALAKLEERKKRDET